MKVYEILIIILLISFTNSVTFTAAFIGIRVNSDYHDVSGTGPADIPNYYNGKVFSFYEVFFVSNTFNNISSDLQEKIRLSIEYDNSSTATLTLKTPSSAYDSSNKYYLGIIPKQYWNAFKYYLIDYTGVSFNKKRWILYHKESATSYFLKFFETEEDMIIFEGALLQTGEYYYLKSNNLGAAQAPSSQKSLELEAIFLSN